MTSLLIALLLVQGAGAAQVLGAVSGRIVFQDGKPAANTRVMAIAADEDPAGTGTAIMSFAETDGNGRYRLEYIPPGRYYISAGLVSYPSYYPGTDRKSARIVTVAPGERLEGFDFAMLTRRVTGRFVRANSEPVRTGPGNEVRLTLDAGQSMTARVNEDGTFEFLNVPPGTFNLRARPPLAAPTAQVVVADEDVTNANLVLSPIKVVNGRVVVEGDAPMPQFALNTVESSSSGGAATTVKVMISTERSFTLRMQEGVHPISVVPESLPDGYTVKALKYGRIDLLKEPLRVEMADTAELVVTLQSPRHQRVRVSGRVVPFDASLPTSVVRLESPSFVGIYSALVRNDGSFRITDVMPGRYTVTTTLSGASAPAVVVGTSDVEGIEVIIPSPVAADPEKTIGTLSWIIYEAFSGAVVDRGSGPVRVKDVALLERGQGPDLRIQKTIALSNRFSLVLSEPVTEWSTAKTDFAFSVRHPEYQTTSYESFRIDSPTRATQRQDPVEVGIAITEVAPRRWEVTRMDFLTDFSIEVSHSAMVPRGSPYWRVVILKGSNVTWPSLINGKTRAN